MSEEVSAPPSPGFPMLSGVTMPPVAQQWLARIGGPRRLGTIGVGIAAVLMVMAVAKWATAPNWVPVYSDLPLENVGTITDRLDERGIPYRLAGNGTQLLVASTDLARARVSTSGEGMPTAGRPGLEIFDKPAWGMTDFTQRVNYRRAMEGELERTIGKMRGVESVKVHVAMEEATGFRNSDAEPEASVVIKLTRGTSPSQAMVEGIEHLVSSSIDGVTPENVTVLDDTGRLMSDPDDAGSLAGIASRDLKMRREIEKYLTDKAEGIVTQIVGIGNVKIQVSAELNLDRVERTVETVDPDRQVLASEQRSEIIPGADGGAGSTNVTSTYLNTRSVETYSGAVGSVKRVTAAILINDKMVTDEAGVSYEPRTPEELQQIEMLVSNAMGLDPSRGDIINIVSFPFDDGFDFVDDPTFMDMVRDYQRPGIALLALLATLAIAFRITRTLKTPEAPATPAQLAAAKGEKLDLTVGESSDALEAGDDDNELESGMPEYQLPKPKSGPSTRDLVAAQIDSQPDVAAKLIRSWMKED